MTEHNGQSLPAVAMPAPWERLPGESAVAYRAFKAFLDFGPRRTLAMVGHALYPPKNGVVRRRGQRPGRLADWSAKWRWHQRAAAWDGEIDRQALEADLEAILAMRKRHAAEAVELEGKALEALRKIPKSKLTPRVALSVYQAAVEIERKARGDSSFPQRKAGPEQNGPATNVNTIAVLADPAAIQLVATLLERLTTGAAVAGRVGLVRERQALDLAAPPNLAQSALDGIGGGPMPAANRDDASPTRQVDAVLAISPGVVPGDVPRSARDAGEL